MYWDLLVPEAVAEHVGAEVVKMELVAARFFQEFEHRIWCVTTSDQLQWWAISFPEVKVYPYERGRDLDDLFSFHLGSALREMDEAGLIRVHRD